MSNRFGEMASRPPVYGCAIRTGAGSTTLLTWVLHREHGRKLTLFVGEDSTATMLECSFPRLYFVLLNSISTREYRPM